MFALFDERKIGNLFFAYAGTVGTSGRILESLSIKTGMTVGKWRQQLRLMQAMRLLGEGVKVTHAALEAGYSTPQRFYRSVQKIFWDNACGLL